MYFPALGHGARARDNPQATHESDVRGMRVLLVEDNSEVAIATEAVLGEMGCVVTRVASADEAKAFLEDAFDVVDVVLSDIVMPGTTNGIGLAVWMRKTIPRLPVLLMSGYSESVAQGEAHGLRILSKPVAPGPLARALAGLRKD
jgi:CheY-like chemotaxis protein